VSDRRTSATRNQARRRVPTVLVVAGSDPTGGAGLQADLKTLEWFGVASAAAVSAITIQTATRVRASHPVPAPTLQAQLAAVAASISPRVIKCGLLASAANVEVVADFTARRRHCALVVDPVTAASGRGARLSRKDLAQALVERLFPLASVVTVNLPEASNLCGARVTDEAAMADAARAIADMGPHAVVIKGGHLRGPPVDVLYCGGRLRRFPGVRAPATMHGTGCAFASALAAGLALGFGVARAVEDAGAHVRALIAASQRTRDGGRLRAPLAPRKTR
jgi:hydroxymethylpyrimidine kinase/phosphomethylpyrimidine kinase